MSLVTEMLVYWRWPVFLEEREPLSKDTLIDMARLLAFSLGGVFTLLIVTGILFQLLGVERPNMSNDFVKASQQSYFIVFALILAPLVEEIIFRSWLGVKWGVLLILPILLWSVGVVTFLQEKPLPYTLDVACLIGLTVLVGFYIVQYCRTASRPHFQDEALTRIFPFIFWGTLFAFGLVHLTNFEIANFHPLIILIVLPHIFIGGVLGFLRMRFGLLSAILFHAAYNAVLILLSLLVLPGAT